MIAGFPQKPRVGRPYAAGINAPEGVMARIAGGVTPAYAAVARNIAICVGGPWSGSSGPMPEKLT
jgi:hypothetical protein